MPSAPDAIDALAELLGVTRKELIAAIVRASHRDWQRTLRRELRKMQEIFDDDELVLEEE